MVDQWSDGHIQTDGWSDGHIKQPRKPQAEIRKGPGKLAYALSDIARPVLTGVGAGLGGVLGGTAGGAGGLAGGPAAPATVPYGAIAGSVAGAGLGYATGNKLADTLDSALGISQPPDLKGATLRTLKDISTGATMEMGGQVGGKLINSGLSALAKRGGMPYSAAANKVQAGRVLENAYGNPTAEEAANAARVEAIRKRGGITVPLTRAQQTGSTKAAAFEQGMAGNRELMDTLTKNDTTARETALGRVKAALGRGRTLPTSTDPQAVGANIHGAINSALEPVKAAERVIWGEVPSYPMPNSNLQSAIKAATGEPLEKPVQDAVRSTVDYINQVPKNTEGLRAIDRTLSNNISKALKAGDNNLARVYQNIKAGVTADFKAMSEAAEAGDVALFNGEVVYPGRLASEMKDISNRITEAQSKVLPDVSVMQKRLTERQIPAMRQRNETEEGFANRLASEWNRLNMGPLPTGTVSSKEIEPLLARQGKIQEMLDNLQPADDVAGAYRAAKDFSRKKFERFDRGATGKVLAKGNEIEGQRLPYEQIPSRFYSPSGANDLIRAVGREQAGVQMKPHVVNDLLAKAAPNGELNVLQAERYLRKNMPTLKRLGLDGEVRDIIKGQLPNEFERMLATRRVDRLTDNPYFTTQEAAKLLRDYAPLINKYYGRDAVQSLRDYHSLMKILNRNKNVSYSGGSNTWEKFANNPDELVPVGRKVVQAVTEVLLGAGAGAMVHGTAGAVAGAATASAGKTVTSILAENARKQTARLLREAIANPAQAKALMQIARASDAKAAAVAKRVLAPWLTGAQGAIAGAVTNIENRANEAESAPVTE